MSAKEKLDKTLTEIKKMKPYVYKVVTVVKNNSIKAGQVAIPFLKKGYHKLKEEVDAQIKKYQAHKAAAQQPTTANSTSPPTTPKQPSEASQTTANNQENKE